MKMPFQFIEPLLCTRYRKYFFGLIVKTILGLGWRYLPHLTVRKTKALEGWIIVQFLELANVARVQSQVDSTQALNH